VSLDQANFHERTSSKPVKVTVPTGCEVSFPAQLLKKYDYLTKGANILLQQLVSGISYTANSNCIKPGTFKNGTFNGHWEFMIAKGTLSFMP
jgi:hypothetical protein